MKTVRTDAARDSSGFVLMLKIECHTCDQKSERK